MPHRKEVQHENHKIVISLRPTITGLIPCLVKEVSKL
jgi:hypothetical protein